MLRNSALVLLLLSVCVLAQQPAAPVEALTIESIASGKFNGRLPETVTFSPDGTKVSFIQRDDSGEKGELWYIDVATGEKAVLVAESKLSSLAPPTSKISDERLREWRSRYGVAAYHWSPDSKFLLFDSKGQLWLHRLDTGTAVQVTSAPEPSTDPKFSPDGKKLAYVRKHNLWVRDIPDGNERPLTKTTEDDGDDVLNGEVDWVYAEELKVHSNYFWSPDGKQIVFLQMNEKEVPTYPIVDYSPNHARADMQKYPNPGDPNPSVRIGVQDVGSGKTRWIKLPADDTEYVPRFGWVRPGVIWIQALNRAQQKLVLYFADLNGNAHPVLTESSDAWVTERDDLHFLKSGDRFLWTSWRDGHTHIYLYKFDAANPFAGKAQLVNQVTKGDFEVSSIDAVDDTAGAIYFTADPKDPRQRQLFSVKLDGSGTAQISKQPGTHASSFGPNAAHFVDRYSNLLTPPSLSLCARDGICKQIVAAADVSAASLHKPEWLELTAADGKTKLYGMLFQPATDSGKRLPVILHPYGGPSGQSVRDEWGREGGLLQFYLADHGFAVLVVDNRGMANRGRDFNAFLKSKFGEIELADQLAALDQVVKKYPGLDGSRVGIYGGSYGGFMTLYALTHSDRFKAGVAIAPVSNWHYYDSIYTERYLGDPTKNESGYTTSSPTNAADKLSGALRIAHGTSDDNVHAQNTIQMTQGLIKAHTPFELMFYPNKTHGINGFDATLHLYHSIEDHFARYLLSGGSAQ